MNGKGKTILFAIALLFPLGQQATAEPASPYPIRYCLPDKSCITITLKGDEHASWAITPDGYTVLPNDDGFYEYAINDAKGDLILSGWRAHNEAERTPDERAFLQTTPQRAAYSRQQLQQLRTVHGNVANELRNTTAVHPPSTGTVRAVLILVDFPDVQFSKTKADFEAIVNQPNYTAGGTITGSVHDFYYDNSNGKLDFSVDIFGPYRMPLGIKYYDDKSSGIPRNMAKIAVQAAHDQDSCNFADYDIDGDGFVDAVHIIYAGYSQSSGGKKGESIWPHTGQFEAVFGATGLDGKKFRKYSCSAELRGTSGNNITYIGSMAHELGHVFGLPDFYDVDDSNYSEAALGIGKWDIMASGSHNDNGRTPANHSAWTRDYLDWVTAVELTDPTEITLPHPDSAKVIYRIPTQTPNEYFLLENRQQTGWDKSIPSEGLLIYHVDMNYSGWNNQAVNDNPAHRGYYIKQAGGGADSKESDHRERDPYPYGSNNSFTDTSVPNALSWAGAETGKPVTNITLNGDGSVSFSFMDGMNRLPTLADEAFAVYRQGDAWFAANRSKQPETLSLYDIAGRKLSEQTIGNGADIKLNIPLKSGVYLVGMSDGTVKKIIQ